MNFPKIASLNTPSKFAAHLQTLGWDIPFDSDLDSSELAPLAQPIKFASRRIGNRFCILPMEGWDATREGAPSELTQRRWRRFGASGAKLIWGGEAVAVRSDGRANPHQLLISEANLPSFSNLRVELVNAHREKFGQVDDLFIGLQLTHSGRFSRPDSDGRLRPVIAYRHPHLDALVKLKEGGFECYSDSEIRLLIKDFVAAAALTERAGFDFVDIKHCHGYFGHELLSAYQRQGEFGGSFENRTRFLREIVSGIRAVTRQLEIGVRLSVFDFSPFVKLDDPDQNFDVKDFSVRYFGAGVGGRDVDLSEPLKFVALLNELGIKLICTTAGSPYYCPHIQRPAQFPPSDGYAPPEDPLVGVARQVEVTAKLKQAFPQMTFVGSGYSYLQEWLPNVGQALIRLNQVDSIGLGRMALSYPELPRDVLQGSGLKRKKICRTFSDCTTAPRQGMVSGCFPLDEFYRQMPERGKLVELRRARK